MIRQKNNLSCELTLFVNDRYDEAVWLLFQSLEESNLEFIPGFAYDCISDNEIEVLLSEDLNIVDINLGWESDLNFSRNKSVPDDKKHAMRIAKIVSGILDGSFICEPVHFDTEAALTSSSFIVDGHHRIRALQFLGFDGFPVVCSGDVKIIDSLNAGCMKVSS